mgnify:CR=1 FL=1
MISNPVAKRYANEMVRPCCDLLAGAISYLDQVLLDARPDALDLPDLFPADGGPVEGSDDGGRVAVTGADVHAFLRLATVLVTMADDDRDPQTGAHTGLTSRALINKLRVNLRRA